MIWFAVGFPVLVVGITLGVLWLRRRADRPDALTEATAWAAFNSGRPVLTTVDENGLVKMRYLDDDSGVGGDSRPESKD